MGLVQIEPARMPPPKAAPTRQRGGWPSTANKLWAPKRPEPSYPRLPRVDDRSETTVPGVYAIGEVAGTPLIKLGLNQGHDLVMRLSAELVAERAAAGERDIHDLVIVGAGSAGLGAAAAARQVGLRAVVIEANHLAETVYTMTKGKWIFAEPVDVPLRSPLYLEECTRETLLEKWAEQVRTMDLDVRTFEKVQDIRRSGSTLDVTTDKGAYEARRVILAIGKSGNPRKAGVPGEVEFAARIDHRLIDPDRHGDQDILIYGGGDVALEAALALCAHNRVTLVTIDPEFTYPKKRNIDAVMAEVGAGRIRLHFDARLESIGERDVTFRAGGVEHRIANDHVFEMIGGELPLEFFRKVGVRLENTWTAGRWIALAAVALTVYSFYALKSYGKGWIAWPFESLIAPETYDGVLGALFRAAFTPFAWLFSDRALADMARDRGYQQGYLYSGLYTVVMLVFGWQALVRWRGYARDKRYQTYRYASLLGFQCAFFLIVNVLAVRALELKYAWRAWGLYQPFPLFFNTFFWWYSGDPPGVWMFFVGAGLLGTFVAIPWMARNHGKRFCTWVCGCGGLAETLGDRWRHLSAKGERSRIWEFQAAVVLVAAFVVALVVVGMYRTEGNNPWWRAYSYLVDFWLVAVIPVGLYPFFGGKVWCRYWCPLAAWNQVLARWYGRLKIRSNDHCISCNQCSKYCQVGVDVMAFAKNQAPFDNRNSGCIQCGICIDVCPMGVLSFDTGEVEARL
jgi:NosR/NirI family transcriptional regulator, nitrous oxide reductase regulator